MGRGGRVCCCWGWDGWEEAGVVEGEEDVAAALQLNDLLRCLAPAPPLPLSDDEGFPSLVPLVSFWCDDDCPFFKEDLGRPFLPLPLPECSPFLLTSFELPLPLLLSAVPCCRGGALESLLSRSPEGESVSIGDCRPRFCCCCCFISPSTDRLLADPEPEPDMITQLWKGLIFAAPKRCYS